MHDCVIPRYLYAHITLKGYWNPAGGHTHPYLETLTRRLTEDPLLASRVRSITFPDPWDAEDDENEEVENDDEDEQVDDESTNSIRRASLQDVEPCDNYYDFVPVEEGKIVSMMERDNDMAVARLLSAVPNLEILDIVAPSYAAIHTLGVFERATTAVQGANDMARQPLQNLRVIAYHNDSSDYPRSFSYPLSFFRLPSVRELFLSGLSVEDGEEDMFDEDDLSKTLPTGCSAVEILELYDCRLYLVELQTILRSCRSLRTLIYEIEWQFFEESYTSDGLQRALSGQEETLENLWIDFAHGPQIWTLPYEPEFLLPWPAFSGFRKLKNLRIGTWIFFRSSSVYESTLGPEDDYDDENIEASVPDLGSLLPPCLDHLYIGHTTRRPHMLVKALENLVFLKSTYVPALKYITFEASAVGNDQGPCLERLKLLAVAMGVGLQICEHIDAVW